VSELLLIALGAALVNNLALAELLGASAMLRAARGIDAAIASAIATGLLILFATALTGLVETALLRRFDLPHLRLVLFVVTIAASAWLLEAALRRVAPQLHGAVPARLLAVNAAVLGVALLNAAASRGPAATLIYAGGTALGFGLALVLFAGLRERLARADVPVAFSGAPIVFVTAGILSLAFLAFAGFARL
jgi:electron transport complex protein RnfA